MTAKVNGKIRKRGAAFIFFICMMFLYVCLPVGAQAAELGEKAETEILGGGGDFLSPDSDVLNDGTTYSPEEEIFSSAGREAFTDEPEEYTEQETEMLLGSNTDSVWVNNVDLLADTDHEIQCGSGTVSYDISTNTLTLANATIDVRNTNIPQLINTSFIWLNTEGDCTIVLEGENYITKSDDVSQNGIMQFDNRRLR